MYTVYGIPNCDSVRKALNWLKENNFAYEFHDFKKQGITAKKVEQWTRQAGLEKLLNTKGSTWRGLEEDEKLKAATDAGAIELMTEKSSLIKRPVIEKRGMVVTIGFDANIYANKLG